MVLYSKKTYFYILKNLNYLLMKVKLLPIVFITAISFSQTKEDVAMATSSFVCEKDMAVIKTIGSSFTFINK